MSLITDLPVDQVTAPMQLDPATAQLAHNRLTRLAPDLLAMVAPLTTIHPQPANPTNTGGRALPLRGGNAR